MGKTAGNTATRTPAGKSFKKGTKRVKKRIVQQQGRGVYMEKKMVKNNSIYMPPPIKEFGRGGGAGPTGEGYTDSLKGMNGYWRKKKQKGPK